MERRKQTNPLTEPPGLTAGVGSPAGSRRRKPFTAFVFTFFIMFVFWVLLSGKFDLFHLSLGIISCAIVAHLSSDLLFHNIDISLSGLVVSWVRFVRYIPWLMYQIFLANLHLMYLTFHPRMMELIDPQIIRFRTRLRGELSRVTFANSITLTPGTITVYLSLDGDFRVHAIDKESREGLPGEMEARIAKAFGEE